MCVVVIRSLKIKETEHLLIVKNLDLLVLCEIKLKGRVWKLFWNTLGCKNSIVEDAKAGEGVVVLMKRS